MKTKMVVMIGILAGLIGLHGCGTNDPLSILGDTNPPTLESIFANNSAAASGTGFSSAHPYWELLPSGFIYGTNVLAPAKGFVSSLGFDSATGTNFITIAHGGRLSTRISGVSATVRSGDMVVAGQLIGSFLNSGNISFQVLLSHRWVWAG